MLLLFSKNTKKTTFFPIFDYSLIYQLLFESAVGKKPVGSIVRAQTVALSDSGLNQVQRTPPDKVRKIIFFWDFSHIASVKERIFLHMFLNLL